ncbi:MAG: pitrilysin family protein [Actinomycetaceae bacterium]|nr:pitrilysin family protein [Actinomycetaceae bacterium]
MSAPIIDLPMVASTHPDAELTLLDEETQIRRTILPGGLRVLSQHVPAQRSVSLSVWCPIGSRHEEPQRAGSSHFLEHLLFKGTAHRSAAELANAFDEVGGDSNAGTTKEYTYYWARVLGEDLAMAVGTLLEMVTSSVLNETEFDRERGVILDELAMGADDPSEVVHEGFSRAVFGSHPLGRPIGGSIDTVQAAVRDQVWQFYREQYIASNLVVVAAGAVDHDQLCEQVMRAMEEANWTLDAHAAPQTKAAQGQAPSFTSRAQSQHKPGEQAHLIVGGRGISAADERRSHMTVLLSLLGGSMSSRLFQVIREQRGLAYTTYAFDHSYSDYGCFGMYAGCAPRHLEQVEELMWGQLKDLANGGVGEAELKRVKGQMRGAVALGLEDSSARMVRLGLAEIVHHRFTPLARTMKNIRSTSAEDVAALATDLLNQPSCRSVVSPLADL